MLRTDGGYGVPGMPGNGGLRDLVYRGEPSQMMPLPYYGGGMNVQQLAGGPSFDINPGSAGDSRRKRKGLSPQDVDRLIQANPQFERQIREMYLPGVQGTPFFNRAGIPAGFDGKYVS